MNNSFNCLSSLAHGGKQYNFFDLSKLEVNHLPFSLKILLENLLRCEGNGAVTKEDVLKLINHKPDSTKSEIAFTPARVILQDFTGVPAVVDLAAMREAFVKMGKDADKINPLNPVELVIDHSIMVDYFGNKDALKLNAKREYERNKERYEFLRWGGEAFKNFKVVPPSTGIVHQVNLEYLARVVFVNDDNNLIYPDTLVGTDSHTTMINGLGVLGWGVGGIEAEGSMLGQSIPMLIPEVVGFKLHGALNDGVTATDLVLVVVEMLRVFGVVGKFVEFFGDGLDNLPLADRATIANMAPEYGATCGIFPIDNETLNYLKQSGRDDKQIELVEKYAKANGMFRMPGKTQATYDAVLELDLSTVVPSIAGPKRPQDRIELNKAKLAFNNNLKEAKADANKSVACEFNKQKFELKQGAVVIAAITSCTNTSNPDVMLAAGIIAKRAHDLGLKVKPWVKTSLAPGSQVVTDYLQKANLLEPLESLGFNLVGYGCTTCIGNSGPLPENIHDAIVENDLTVCAVLSGNRNFEGRIHPNVKNAYLASPPLCVIYALAGTMDIDLYNEPLGMDKNNKAVYLKDLWPSTKDVKDVVSKNIQAEMFKSRYKDVYKGDASWQEIKVTKSKNYDWDEKSTYVKHPPFFADIVNSSNHDSEIKNAKCLALLGDSVTTDHISPAGAIKADSPAGIYLQANGVVERDFNSYGSRRGNHEVMMRGTFANVRINNQLAEGKIGGFTKHFGSNKIMPIYDAAMEYQKTNTPLIIIAGAEYGTGSSRDWAAKGTKLLGVKAVIAKSFERIHRSNLIGMGVLPLQFKDSNAEKLALTGSEEFSIDLSTLTANAQLTVKTNTNKEFSVTCRIDTPKELEYYKAGGILNYVLKQLAG